MKIGRIDRDDNLHERTIAHTFVPGFLLGRSGGVAQPASHKQKADEAKKELFFSVAAEAVASDFANPNFEVEAVELGTDRVLKKHRWAYAFNVAPSQMLDASSFRQIISLTRDFRGDIYLVEIGNTVTPIVDGYVEKVPAAHGSTAPDGSPILVAEYIVKDSTGKKLGSYDWQGLPKSGMAEGRLFYIPSVYPDNPFRAWPTAEKANLSVDVSQYKRIATRSVLRNAGQPAGLVTLPAARRKEEVTSFRDRLNSWLADPNRRGQTMVITDDIKYTQLGDTAPGTGWDAIGTQARDEILACWAMPVSRLGMGGSRTYENQRVELGAYYRHTIVARWNQVLAAINRVLRQEGVYLRLNVDKVQELHEEADSVSQRVIAEWRSGIRTLNEAREAAGLAALPDGDQLYHDWLRSKGLTEVPVQGTGGSVRDVVPFVATQTRAVEQVNPDSFIQAIDAAVNAAEEDFAVWAHEQHTRVFTGILAALTPIRDDEDDRLLSDVLQGWTVHRLFDPDAFSEEVRPGTIEKLKALAADVIVKVASEIKDETIIGAVDYDQLITARANRLIDGTDDYVGWGRELAEELEAKLTIAFEEGHSVGRFTQDVADMLGVDPENPDAGTMSRARRIARTELNGTASDVTMESMRRSRVVSGKYWYNPIDGATRPSHAEAAIVYGPGNPIPVDAKFIVGGVPMDAPHDPSAPAREVVNCRCRPVASVLLIET